MLPDAVPTRPTPKIPFWRRWFGFRSERAAWRYLKQQGHEILARNWSCATGELDVVTRHESTLVFVEIRSTETTDLQRPLTSIDQKKQKQIERTARFFLKLNRVKKVAIRFDVLALSWPPGQKEPIIAYFPNAFPASANDAFFD